MDQIDQILTIIDQVDNDLVRFINKLTQILRTSRPLAKGHSVH